MNNNIDILPVNRNHLAEIINVLQSISKYKPSNNQYLNIWENFSRQQNYFGLVAIHNEKVVGYGSIFFVRKIRGGNVGHIEDIAVHQDFRKKGIGKLLINALYQIAQEKKCYKVSLNCKEHNLSFYQKCDFVIDGISLSRFL